MLNNAQRVTFAAALGTQGVLTAGPFAMAQAV